MKLIGGSILIGFSLLALVLKGFTGRGGDILGPGDSWFVRIDVPVCLQILLWVFMGIGVGLIVWELVDSRQARKGGNK